MLKKKTRRTRMVIEVAERIAVMYLNGFAAGYTKSDSCISKTVQNKVITGVGNEVAFHLKSGQEHWIVVFQPSLCFVDRHHSSQLPC